MNKIIYLILVYLFILNNASAQGIESGLVAKYCFSGNANDALGVRNGTVIGATLTTDRFGTANEAYLLNGIADYIKLPSDVWVSGNFSFTGWIYLNNYSFYSRFFEFGNGIDADNVFFCPSRYGTTGASVFTIHQCSSSARTYADAPSATLPLSTWVHIAITLTGDTAMIYKNNTLWYTYKMIYTPCATTRTQCYFGKSNFPSDQYLSGKIDDIRIYNRSISASEIDSIYKLTGCGKTVVPCDPTIRFAKANNDTSLCVDATGKAMVNLMATGGTTYLWSPASLFANPALATVSTSISSSTQFIVKVTNALGCTDYDTVNVTVHPLPAVLAAPHTATICNGGQINLSATGAVSYVWTPSIGLSSSTVANPTLTVLAPNSKYYVKGKDANGCQNSDSINITITSGPTVKALPKDTFGCIGTNIIISAAGAKTYKWFPPTGISNDTMAHPTLTIVGSLDYVVSGKDANGCAGLDTIHINAFPAPNVKAIQDNATGECGATNVQLHATGAINYTWTPSIYCDNNRSADPKVTIPNTVVFTVVGTNDKGCSHSDTITVFYMGKTVVSIPNAFTPDNDQLNDKIRPIVICDFVLSEFAVYNRWGQQMFISYNINDAWDGRHNGALCDMDVYYYYAKGKNSLGEEIVFKGDITLIR
jgi:gliding motility-associated-like protein